MTTNDLKPLIYEGGNLSAGRILLWVLVSLALFKFWFWGIDIPPGLKELLMATLLYNLGKKFA